MPHTVQLFVTCIIDTLYPEVGESVLHILERGGAQVSCPAGQTCCGQPAFNAGMRHQARQMAIHTLRVFEPAQGDVVVPSGSCAAMLRHGYLELFADEPAWLERARTLAARTYELTEYLVDVLGVVDVGARFEGKVTYHSSCHLLRELGVDQQPRRLLENVRLAEFVELPEGQDCCGFGGVFSVEHPEISAEMMSRKLANLQASGAQLVVACDAGCITNLSGGLRRKRMPQKAIHIASLLDNSKNI